MRKTFRNIVIMNAFEPEFWTGAGWSTEYPDAMVFDSANDAARELRGAMSTNDRLKSKFVSNYGTPEQVEI